MDTDRPRTRNFGLDAMRSGAIACVILCHYGGFVWVRSGLPHGDLVFISGVLGVETFFVLSGFLIGNMLLDIVERGTTWSRWKTFIQRRALRVMPVYYIWLLVLLFVTAARPAPLVSLGYFTFTQNLAWPMPDDNWFGVSWSLTVEMWFYLLFGGLALVSTRLWGMRGFNVVLMLFLCAPVAARSVVSLDVPWDSCIRKVALLRLDAIAYGVLIARLMRQTRWMDTNRTMLALAGLVFMVGTLAWWIWVLGSYDLQDRPDRTLLMNGFLAGIALLVPTILRSDCRRRIVRLAITWLSDVSYAVYLVHLTVLTWFLRVADEKHISISLAATAALVLTLLVATVSRVAVERPILSRRPKST